MKRNRVEDATLIVEDMTFDQLPTTDRLTELYVQFAEAIIVKLDNWSAEDKTEFGTHDRLHYRNSGGTSTFPEVRGGHRRVLQKHIEEIRGMPEYIDCVNAHIAAGKIIEHDLKIIRGNEEEALNDPYKKEFPFFQMIEPIVDLRDRYRTDYPGDESLITQDEIIYSYLHGQGTWVSQSLRWEITTLLLNFHCDVKESFAFDNSISLNPLPPPEKNLLRQRLINGSGAKIGTSEFLDTQSLRESKARLVGFIDTDPAIADTPEADNVTSSMWLMVSSLRLLKRGSFGTSNIVIFPNFGFRGCSMTSYWNDEITMPGRRDPGLYKSRYELLSSHAKEIWYLSPTFARMSVTLWQRV